MKVTGKSFLGVLFALMLALATSMVVIGCTGADGDDGANGVDGTNGTNGTDGVDGADGADGTDGIDGLDGDDCTVEPDQNDPSIKIITCGTASITVADGQDVDPATLDDIHAQLGALNEAEPESCAVCHKHAGEKHQAVYDSAYGDASKLQLMIVGVSSVDDGAGGFDATLTFSITKNGLPYMDIDGLPSLDQKRFYTIRYDATGDFLDSQSFGNIMAGATPGQFTATALGMSYQTEATSAVAYGYIADEAVHTESGGHIHLYSDVSNAAMEYGTVDYVSSANASGCEKCHGAPYMKHGYRAAAVPGTDDFVACKTCHYDNRTGGHEDWQILVDDPLRYTEIAGGDPMTIEEEAKYAYTANVMNDTHMSHAMEFAYPQSIANCVTCHEGNLDVIQADANFTVETCKSCHAQTGSATYGTNGKAPALSDIWAAGHTIDMDCAGCHKAGGMGAAVLMSTLHNGGYDPLIYTSAGVRYSDTFVASVDAVSFDSVTNLLTIEFSAAELPDAAAVASLEAGDIIPTVGVGLYGYDTKDFIVAAHGRDNDSNRLLEFAVDGVTTNPRFTVVDTGVAGTWEVVADLSMWAQMITDGVVKRAEIVVMPAQIIPVGASDVDDGSCVDSCSRGLHCESTVCVENDDLTLGLNAVSKTFNIAGNDFEMFYSDIANVDKCNACHDQLATTFHSGNRGGSIVGCRLCHVGLSAGSHLEMQSRSIDSYVHAIHAFQPFDSGDVDMTDPVEKINYDHHTAANFPNFTITNCEACHNPGTYDVPDQSKSLPGLLAGTDTWDTDRNVPALPRFNTGPAARACGGCHRAYALNDDDANGLVAFMQHTKSNGYLVQDGEGVLDMIINTIMSIFE